MRYLVGYSIIRWNCNIDFDNEIVSVTSESDITARFIKSFEESHSRNTDGMGFRVKVISISKI